jgi:hypothetical protein
MPITLTDIPAAIDDYLQTEVTTTISPVTPTDTTQDVLTPGQQGKVTVTVTNSDAAKGLRLVDPVYYFEVDDGDVLKLIARSGGLAWVSFGDKDLTNRLDDGAEVSKLWLVPIIENVLDAGETAEATLDVSCKDQGSTKVVTRFFAKVDQDSLFPSGRTGNHHTDVKVA